MFLYPKHGTSEISESVCKAKASNGVTYVLNKNLEYKIDVSEEYKHIFTSV